jgi:hypothetical protein
VHRRDPNGDLYLQLLSGRFIAGHGLVGTDPFPTIAHGQPWLNQQWLAELAFYGLARLVGITGLTIAYALLLAAPLALLLWLCRRKGTVMMFAVAALYGPGLWVVIHPRAAGFTLLAFSAVAAVIATAWLTPRAAGASVFGRGGRCPGCCCCSRSGRIFTGGSSPACFSSP